MEVEKNKKSIKKKGDFEYGLDENFQKILKRKYEKNEFVLMKIKFDLENSGEKLSKKWVKEAIINQIM